MTLDEAAAIADIKTKVAVDDQHILRKEAGLELIPRERNQPLSIDDVAALCGYADLRRAGYPVKLAGTIISRVRAGMRDDPDEPRHTFVLLANGSTFALPTSILDLRSGYTSGSYVVAATIVDVRNLRERVKRQIGAENVAA